MHRGLSAAVLLFATTSIVACNGGGECVELPADCSPLYEPTFEKVFANTLQPSCATGGASCHATEGAQAGLVLDEIDVAHMGLLDGRVEPNDAGCSLMMQRLSSDDPTFMMPPGKMLPDPERCAVQKWIEGGAPR